MDKAELIKRLKELCTDNLCKDFSGSGGNFEAAADRWGDLSHRLKKLIDEAEKEDG